MSLPKNSLSSISVAEGKKLKVSVTKEETGLPELKEKKCMVDWSKPLPTSLQNEFIPEEVLLSLNAAANAGPCPENLLPPKKTKTPKGTLPRTVDNVWHHPTRRNKFRYLIDHPVSLEKAGRDISFLYDIKYVKGETRENAVCPPRPDHPSQSHNGVIVPHKPKRLGDTLIPEEFHIVSNTGVTGLECYDDKYTTLLTDSENRLLLFPSMKPNKRVEVVQLNDVMDTMLERAGVEIQEYAGPTKIHKLLYLLKKEQNIYNTVFHELIRQVSVDCADRGELLSKIRQRYVQMLDQIVRQMIDFYKDLVTQRVMDQRILEELYNFKNVIEELTRELCLVRAHDITLTKEVEKAHGDLAQALLDAEKNSRIVEEYHELYTLQRGRMETDIKQLMAERDIWSSATYELALKVIEKNRIILAKKLYLNEKGWNKYTKHFIILLSTKDTADLALLQKITQKWRNMMTKFKQEIDQTEKSTKETLQFIKEGVIKWQQFFKYYEKDNKENGVEFIISDFKKWQKMLNEEKENYTGDLLVSKYDTLKISKHLQENWVDIGFGIFGRHRSMEGVMPPEHEKMGEIVTNIGRLYNEFEERINGDNGLSKILPNLICSLDYCSFKLEGITELSELSDEEWKKITVKINEIKSQLEVLLNSVGTVPQDMDMECGSTLQTHIFSMIQQWLLNIGNEISNGNLELQRQVDGLHIAMIQWMVNLLLIMVPDFIDQDTLSTSNGESVEANSIKVAELELDAITLARKLYQYTSYLNSCCKGLMTAVALGKARHSQNSSATGLQELVALKKESYEWINTCSHLLSGIKGRKIKLLTPEEKDNLFADEDILKELMESEIHKTTAEDEKEMKDGDKVDKKETEEKPLMSTKEKVIRFIGEDENIHSRPLFGPDMFSSWRESAEQGVLAQKYLEAMLIIEHTQEKLIQVESRAREAEEKFEDINERLHHTLIKNKDLEKEIEALKFIEKEAEGGKEEEYDAEREEEKQEEEEVKPQTSLTPTNKEQQRKEDTIPNTKSRTKTKSNHKMKPK